MRAVSGIAIVVCVWLLASVACGQTADQGQVGTTGAQLSLSHDFKDPTLIAMSDSVRVACFATGQGRPILFLHGGPGIPFPQPIAALSVLDSNYTIVYYDQRGCGRSDRPIDVLPEGGFMTKASRLQRYYGITRQVKDIEELRVHLGEEKLILMGHSFGTFMATLYALEHPDRVEKMVFIGPANMLKFPASDGGLFELLRPLLPDSMLADYDDFLKRYFNYNENMVLSDSVMTKLNCELFPYYFAAAKAKDFAVPEGITCASLGGWTTHGIYLSMGMQFDHTPSIKAVEAPVLVIHGERDIQSEAASRTYSEAYPNAEFRVITDAGHFPFLDQPKLFGDVVAEFLSVDPE